ncbi:hypothetical protein ACQKKK_26195, partial [Peribacillus sp. NPDC006672]|uniref:hypothetical protein n=1 Tax=Peribacillus sp. NPDC006672 TaxID=3390606 RepID=UPI003CFF4DEA
YKLKRRIREPYVRCCERGENNTFIFPLLDCNYRGSLVEYEGVESYFKQIYKSETINSITILNVAMI